MLRRHRSVLLCGLLASVATGCLEDEAASQRTEVQNALAEATAQLRVATIAPVHPDDESAESVRAALDSVVRRLSSVSGGEPGQNTAKGMLAASAHRELALMDQAQAYSIEREHRIERSILRGKADALLELLDSAAALETQAAPPELAMLSSSRESTESDLDMTSEAIATLDEPIAVRTAANNSDAREVDDLRQQADDLLRRASELGHADGFATYEEAIELRRRADLIEFEIAGREIELDYELQPQHDYASEVARQLQTREGSIDKALTSIQTLADAVAEQADMTRQAASTLIAEIDTGIAGITDSSETDLAASYEAATAHLDQAASLASQAARGVPGETSSSANLLAAQVFEQQGRLRTEQVRGLSDQAALLTRLVEIDGLEQFRPALDDLSIRIDEARASGAEAFERAGQTLGSVNSRSLTTQIEAMKQNISAANSALKGEAVTLAITPATPAAPTRSGTPAASGQGFPTPEALVQYLNGVNWSDLQGSQTAFMNTTHAATPESGAWLNAANDAVTSMVQFIDAMQSKYGADADAVTQGMAQGSAMSAPTKVQVQSQDEQRATATFTTAMGAPGTLELINVDGSWYFDAESVAAISAVAPGMSLAENTKLQRTMGQTLAALTARINAGEFPSATEAGMAFAQAVGEALAEYMPAGMPGMPQP